MNEIYDYPPTKTRLAQQMSCGEIVSIKIRNRHQLADWDRLDAKVEKHLRDCPKCKARNTAWESR